MGYCIRKKYIRLIKTKSTKQKKNQIPNLPVKVREKLYEIARKKIFKNHKIDTIIHKENMVKLNYKWPTTPIIDEKERKNILTL